MKAVWDGFVALLEAVPAVWYGIAFCALWAGLTARRRAS